MTVDEQDNGRDPDAGPAAARLRELHAGRARRGARGGRPCHLGTPAHAGAVRARRSTAPASRAVPGLPGAVGHLRRPVLAAVRLDRARHGHLGSRGRVPAVPFDPPAAVRQGTGARAGTSADGHDRPSSSRREPTPTVRSAPRGSSRAWSATTSPCSSASGSRPRPGVDDAAAPAAPDRPGSRSLPVTSTSLIGRGAGHRQRVDAAAVARGPVGHPDRPRWRRQDAARDRRGGTTGGPLPARSGVRPAGVDRSTRRWCCRASQPSSAPPSTVPARPSDVLVEHLADAPTLLVLDNLEQVVGVAPDLDRLLARCAGLAILVTSRTALRLRAEREYPVGALTVPAFSDRPGMERAGRTARRAALRRSSPGRPLRLRADRGQRAGRRGDLPAPRRSAARHRARGGAQPAAGSGCAARPARTSSRRPGSRAGRSPRAPAHPSRDRRVERRTAGGRRAADAGDPVGLRRGMDRRSGHARLRPSRGPDARPARRALRAQPRAPST